MVRFLFGALALSIVTTLTAAEPPKGFTALFNGKDFTNFKGWSIHSKGGSPVDLAKLSPEERAKKFEAWTAELKDHWTVENGELVNKGTGPFLASEKEYGDFELLIEYKLTKTVDAGLYPKTIPQIQVWDPEDPSQVKNGNAKGSGGLWNNQPADAVERFPLVKADKPAGEWNQFRIIVLGERCTVYLNDKLVVDHARLQNYYDRKAPVPKFASFLLQTHAPKLPIHWRNIFIREIGSEEANKMLAAKIGDGFTSLFNGKDFDGWQGAVDNYEVVEGAIRCKKGKGGALYTKEEYADFQVAIEFKLPKNGNNGLAIRYPGKGDGAYTGMTELQVLDDDYKGIDPRQAHGSAYGMAAAVRGYQRPIGEWNFQTVTVKGSTIQVELNGTQILNTDLSKITEYMGKSPHPGKELTKGFFGFLGHNDPVEFRNVMIKTLK
jgi:hypothetical protein